MHHFRQNIKIWEGFTDDFWQIYHCLFLCCDISSTESFCNCQCREWPLYSRPHKSLFGICPQYSTSCLILLYNNHSQADIWSLLVNLGQQYENAVYYALNTWPIYLVTEMWHHTLPGSFHTNSTPPSDKSLTFQGHLKITSKQETQDFILINHYFIQQDFEITFVSSLLLNQ